MLKVYLFFLIYFFNLSIMAEAVSFPNIKEDITEIDMTKERIAGEKIQTYFNYYNVKVEGAKHYYGKLFFAGQQIFVNIFEPSKSKGTIFFFHGYLEHSALNMPFVRRALKENYTIALIDLPGHGLSSGEKGTIDSFQIYDLVLQKFIAWGQENLKGPFSIIAFSTSAGLILQDIFRSHLEEIDKIVLVAPLIRSALWQISKFTFAVLDLLSIEPLSIPRVYRESSSDENFLAFFKKDPLGPKRIPYSYVKSLIRWNEYMETMSGDSISRTCLVIQGDNDNIVDWKWNTTFIKKNLLGAEIQIVHKGMHQLLNESASIRKGVFEKIFQHIKRDN